MSPIRLEGVCAEFDRSFDESSYEEKIAKLIKKNDRRCRREDDQEYRRWRSAVQHLAQEDTYIGVMIARADLRPRWDLLKLLATGVLVACVVVAAAVLMDRWGIEWPPREALRFWIWMAMVSAAVAYCLVRLIGGKDRLDSALDWLWRVFETRPRARQLK